MVKLNKGDNLAIDLSDSFDSIVTLLLMAQPSQKMMTAQMVAQILCYYPHHKGRDIFHSRRAFGNRVGSFKLKVTRQPV